MIRPTSSGQLSDFDILTHSPHGEPRALLFRVGDIFPMDPAPHHRSRIDEPATAARPFGMRFLRVPSPRAGAHESGTSDFTAGNGNADGSGPEDSDTD
jgi:hypothetical protein